MESQGSSASEVEQGWGQGQGHSPAVLKSISDGLDLFPPGQARWVAGAPGFSL